ncbi:MAG: phenylalanine--tRNA ligase subunit beta [Candidatus Hodarchaeota archaeon]
MPTISVNKDDFLQLIGKDCTLEQLDDLLPNVKGELKKYDKETNEIKIELNDTNRPDLWCPEGIARQFRFKFGDIQYKTPLFDSEMTNSNNKIIVDEKIKTIRPFIGAFIAKEIAITEQFLMQMIQTQETLCDGYGKKRKMIAIGIYNADKITFPIHYKAVDPKSISFIPLGSEEKMDLSEILIKNEKGIEFAHVLDGKSLYPILLDNNSDVLSFPPIINSNKCGEVFVHDNYLFVEVTGTDLRMVLHTLNILAYNFRDRGFKIEPVKTIYPYDTEFGDEISSPYPLKNELEVKIKLFEKYFGSSYTLKDITKYLREYGLTVEMNDNELCNVSTYPYRQDYMHAVDVVEDLAISIGYDKFEPIMPEDFTVGKLSTMTVFEDKVRETMIGLGFEEVISNILTNKQDFQEKTGNLYGNLIEIDNVMTESYSTLRCSLIPSLLKIETQSFQALYPHKIFEVGEVVEKDSADNHGCKTKTKLAALLSHAEANYSEIGSYLENLQYLMFWNTKMKAKNFQIFITGRSGEIMVNGQSIGIIGEIHPEFLDKWTIKMPTVIFELDISMLFSICKIF